MRGVGGFERPFHTSAHSLSEKTTTSKKKKSSKKNKKQKASSVAGGGSGSVASDSGASGTQGTEAASKNKTIPSLLPPAPTEMFQKLADGVTSLPKNTVEAGKKVSHGIQKTGEAVLVKPMKEAVHHLGGGHSSNGSSSGSSSWKKAIETPTNEKRSNADTAALPRAVVESNAKKSSSVGSSSSHNSPDKESADDDDDSSNVSVLHGEEKQHAEALREFNESIRDAFFAKPQRVVAKAGKGIKKNLKKTGDVMFVKPTKAIAKQLHVTSSGSSSDRKEAAISVTKDADDDGDVVAATPALPPDEKLKDMNIIFQKRLKGISIQEYFDLVWSEGTAEGMEPLYGPWLEESGKRDIHISEWETAPEGGGGGGGEEFVGEWCIEKYTMKRTATFEFVRTTHLYTGPPVAKVKQTHRCRMTTDGDRCIVAITIEMDGIPFADCFHVEVRWVATRVGIRNSGSGVQVQIGLHVNFLKSTILSSKIRSGTTEETTKSQLSLFGAVKEACMKHTGVVEEDDEHLNGEVHKQGLETSSFQNCGPFAGLFGLFSRQRRSDDITMSVELALAKLQQVDSLLQKQEEPTTPEQKYEVRAELNNLHMALDKLIDRVQQQQQK